MRDIKKNTLNHVEGQGFFRNPLDADLIEKVLPKFYSECLTEESILSEWKSQAEGKKKII